MAVVWGALAGLITSDISAPGGAKWRVPILAATGGSGTHSTANQSTLTNMTGSPSITVPHTGSFLLRSSGHISQPGASGLSEALVYCVVNGTSAQVMNQLTINGTFHGATVSGTRIRSLTAGDVLTLRVATNNISMTFGGAVPFTLELYAL